MQSIPKKFCFFFQKEENLFIFRILNSKSERKPVTFFCVFVKTAFSFIGREKYFLTYLFYI